MVGQRRLEDLLRVLLDGLVAGFFVRIVDSQAVFDLGDFLARQGQTIGIVGDDHSFGMDVTPLRTSRDFRLLFVGQGLSFFGSMLTYVAIPFQAYDLTGSTLVRCPPPRASVRPVPSTLTRSA